MAEPRKRKLATLRVDEEKNGPLASISTDTSLFSLPPTSNSSSGSHSMPESSDSGSSGLFWATETLQNKMDNQCTTMFHVPEHCAMVMGRDRTCTPDAQNTAHRGGVSTHAPEEAR